MKEIRDIFLTNYRDNCKPFEHYIVKGTLWEGCHVPCSITPLYSFSYLVSLACPNQWIWILIISALVVTFHRYYMYNMKRFSLLAMILTFICMYYITIKPISWTIIYIFPILYWGRNNIKYAAIEIMQDLFFLLVIPYIFL